MGCRKCYAPNNRYCEVGLRHRIEVEAEFIAKEHSLDKRRQHIATFAEQLPDQVEALKKRIIDLFEDIKNGKNISDKNA